MAQSQAKMKIVLESGGNQYDLEKLTDKAKKDFKANNKVALKDINVYVKPEDGKVYYAANGGKITGAVSLD